MSPAGMWKVVGWPTMKQGSGTSCVSSSCESELSESDATSVWTRMQSVAAALVGPAAAATPGDADPGISAAASDNTVFVSSATFFTPTSTVCTADHNPAVWYPSALIVISNPRSKYFAT